MKAIVNRYNIQKRKWVLYDSQTVDSNKNQVIYFKDLETGIKCKDVVTLIKEKLK